MSRKIAPQNSRHRNSPLTNSLLFQDEVEPPSICGTCSRGSVGCTASRDKSLSSRFVSHLTGASVRERLGSGPDPFVQDGISYELREGTLESPSSVERSKLESRAFKRPPPARAQKKRAKGEPPTAHEAASLPKLAAPQSPNSLPIAKKNNESNSVALPPHPCTNYVHAGTLTGESRDFEKLNYLLKSIWTIC